MAGKFVMVYHGECVALIQNSLKTKHLSREYVTFFSAAFCQVVTRAASLATSTNVVGALPSSVDLHTGSALPKSTSTMEYRGTCSKAAVQAAFQEPAGPSQGNTKVMKKRQAAVDQPSNAEEIIAQDPVIIYFDLETTGLGYAHEIVQVSCVCSRLEGEGNSVNFNVYALPDGDFDPKASSITGLMKHHNSLYLNGQMVPSVSLSECLRQLVSWLQLLPRSALLLGHNSRNFDAPRLLLALWNCNLLHAFKSTVWGFADSLPWAKATNPTLDRYGLQELSAHYCSADLTAHNALDDCLTLEQVVLALARILPRNRARYDAGKLPSTSEVSRQTRIGRTQQNPGQINGSSCSASNINGAQQDSACAPPNGTCNAQGNSPSSGPCAEKVRLLKTLKPFVFSTCSVMEGIRRSHAARVRLRNTGS